MPEIPELERLRQDHTEIEVSLGHIARLCLQTPNNEHQSPELAEKMAL